MRPDCKNYRHIGLIISNSPDITKEKKIVPDLPHSSAYQPDQGGHQPTGFVASSLKAEPLRLRYQPASLMENQKVADAGENGDMAGNHHRDGQTAAD
jgi:hypothetical protein